MRVMSTLLADVRFTLRNLRRSPGFTAAALVTIALGIGAVTAVMTLVNAVLFRSLPYQDADRIVFLRGETRTDPTAYPLGYQDIADLSAERALFSAVSPVTGVRSFNLTAGSDVEHISGEMVGAEFFEALGARLHLGRMFSDEESRPPSAARVAVISHDLWRRRFASNPAVLGSTMSLNDRTFEIIGVAEPGFRGITDEARVWLPIGAAHVIYGPHYTDMRMFRWLSGVARLQPGVSLEQASAGVRTAADRMTQAWPKENGHLSVTTTPLADVFFGDIRSPLLALLAAAAFVLRIGCVNVSNLLLARGASRQKELAVRLTLGAGRWRLVRQLLTESLTLVTLGAIVGVALAWLLTRLMSNAAQAELASFIAVRLDAGVLAFTIAISCVAAVLFGLVPALAASRLSPVDGMKDGGRSATQGSGRKRLQAALVAVEVTLSLTLLAGAALMTKGFTRYLSTDLGFDAERVLTLRLDLTADKYRDNERFWSVARDVAERARALPGVEAVTVEGPGFPTGGFYGISFRREGAAPDDPDVSGLRHHVTPGYFETLGVPILAGRDFSAEDRANAPATLIVSESFASRYWPGRNPIGERLLSSGGATTITFTVVGMVRDVQHSGLQTGGLSEPDIYLPLYQFPPRTPAVLTVMARVAGDPVAAMPAFQRAIREAAPDLPAYDVQTMTGRLDQQTARGRYAVLVMGGFALLALVLASVGVYGLIAYSVAQRTREIGIRMALGASRGDVVLMVLRRGAMSLAAGIASGIVAVLILGQVMTSLLYGLDPTDPWVLGGSAMALAVIGLLASWWPAYRASRIDPQVAMREA
jgi:putative ABC transport system permease protein